MTFISYVSQIWLPVTKIMGSYVLFFIQCFDFII